MARSKSILRGALAQEWKAHKEKVRHAMRLRDRKVETESAKEKRIQSLLKDPQKFVEYYFPHYCESPSAKFQIDLAKRVMADPHIQELVPWARGHAKSVWCTLLIPLWLMFRGQLNFMLVVGKTEKAAKTLLLPLRAELHENEMLKEDYGPQARHGDWAEGEFTSTGGIHFVALGMGQSPRGIRYMAHRPDLIVADDLDDNMLSRNPARVQDTVQWFLGDLMKAAGTERTRMLFANNRFSRTSVMHTLMQNPAFTYTQINALNSKGLPSWPEKFTPEFFERARAMSEISFQREYMNAPIEQGRVFKNEWIRWRQPQPLNRYDVITAYMDPTFEANPTSDHKAIVVVGKRDDEYDVLSVFLRQETFDAAIMWWIEQYRALPAGVTMMCYCELIGISTYIKQEVARVEKAAGLSLPIRWDTGKKVNKHLRIDQMSILFGNGKVHFNAQKKGDPDMIRLHEQILGFERGSSMADDGPDALEGAISKMLHWSRSGPRIHTVARPRPQHI